MPGTFPTSPDVDNAYIGTGILYFSFDDITYRDLGEVPNIVLTPEVTTKEQKSSRGGVKSTWIKRVTEIKKTVNFDMLEITPENLAFFAMSDLDTDSDGNVVLLGLSETSIDGYIRFVGDNDVGQRITWEGKVQFTPAGDFNILEEGDDFAKISVSAAVLAHEDDGSYGRWTVRGVGG